MSRLILFSAIFVLFSHAQDVEKKDEKVVRGHVFAWPFSDIEKMQPRGGTSRGQDVVLDEKPSDQWERLQKKVGSKIEKDRRAILALAGSYRVCVDFIETMGFT